MRNWGFVILFLLCSLRSHAYESYYESTESLGRAGVDSGHWDYLHSSFNHPAELHDKRGWRWFLKINGHLSDKTYALLGDLPEVEEGKLEKTLSKHFGEKYTANANGVIGLAYGPLTVIPYYKKARARAELNYKVYPEATGYVQMDTGYMIALGHKIKRTFFGINYFAFERDYDIYTVDMVSSYNETFNHKDKEKLASVNASLGYMLQEKPLEESSVYITWKNLNNPNSSSQYDAYNGDLIPLINLGFQKRYGRWLGDLNLLDINNYYASIWQNRVRLGVSYEFSEYALLRKINAGVVDGSLSLGASVNLFKVVNLSFSTYEKNMYHFYNKKNRFYSLGFEISF